VPPSCTWHDLAQGQPRRSAARKPRRTIVATSISAESLQNAGERVRYRQQTSPVGQALRVCIFGAENLVNADFTRFRTANGLPDRSDPYCTCEIPGKPRSKIQTHVVEDNLNPIWNLEARIPDFVASSDKLVFKVWDRDDDKRDDLLGTVELTAAQILPHGFEGALELTEARPRPTKAILQVKVTEEEIAQLAELMGTLGPRYKALGRGNGSKLAACWSESTLLQRKTRKAHMLRETASKEGLASTAANFHSGPRDDPRALRDRFGVRVPDWTLANCRRSFQQRPPEPLTELKRSKPAEPVMCSTWHGKPLPYHAKNPGEGQSFHRFAASVPASGHPAVHPGAQQGY